MHLLGRGEQQQLHQPCEEGELTMDKSCRMLQLIHHSLKAVILSCLERRQISGDTKVTKQIQ